VKDLNRTIAHIERALTRNLDAPQPQRRSHPNRPRKRTQYVWRAPDAKPSRSPASTKTEGMMDEHR
jgi:hypothetical protein